jgi:hypothetical protein
MSTPWYCYKILQRKLFIPYWRSSLQSLHSQHTTTICNIELKYYKLQTYFSLSLSFSLLRIDIPAPCKVFPKTPKIALTIDDVPQSECYRRKSSGSSVNSTNSTIEPHIYEFQENETRHVEASLVIRFVSSIYINIHSVCLCMRFNMWVTTLFSIPQNSFVQSHCELRWRFHTETPK